MLFEGMSVLLLFNRKQCYQSSVQPTQRPFRHQHQLSAQHQISEVQSTDTFQSLGLSLFQNCSNCTINVAINYPSKLLAKLPFDSNSCMFATCQLHILSKVQFNFVNYTFFPNYNLILWFNLSKLLLCHMPYIGTAIYTLIGTEKF